MIFLLQKRVFVAFLLQKANSKDNYSYNRHVHTWEEVLLCLSACSFSLAIKEIWEADLLGNTLHLVDKGKISAILTWIFTKREHTKRITLVKISFSLWRIFRILPGRVLGLETSSYKQSWLDNHFLSLSQHTSACSVAY